MEILNYQKEGVWSITTCHAAPASVINSKVMIGSHFCHCCIYHIGHNKEAGLVYCDSPINKK